MSYSIQSVQKFIETEIWLLLTFFMFTQSIKFYTFHCHVLKTCLKKVIHQNNQIASKFGVGFCLNTGKRFSLEV